MGIRVRFLPAVGDRAVGGLGDFIHNGAGSMIGPISWPKGDARDMYRKPLRLQWFPVEQDGRRERYVPSILLVNQ